MEVACRLVDLSEMHPGLLWDSIVLAAAAILQERFDSVPYRLSLDVRNVPSFGTNELILNIYPNGIDVGRITRFRRTYEASRQVELAAIAIAGLGLHFAGSHEIRDVAIRGSAADYLVGGEHRRLEIAGRTRRADFWTSWQQKWTRMTDQVGSDFFVCVVEFETSTGRLEFSV
jgi:hypothetical protein